MSKYKIIRSVNFEEALGQIQEAHEEIAKRVDDLISTLLENKAGECGISTNRDQKYVMTRPGISGPRVVLFFHVDEANAKVHLTTISVLPDQDQSDDEEKDWDEI